MGLLGVNVGAARSADEVKKTIEASASYLEGLQKALVKSTGETTRRVANLTSASIDEMLKSIDEGTDRVEDDLGKVEALLDHVEKRTEKWHRI
ncbi:MAG: hypothetical protein K2X77_16680 [Candidatus Obscuribacterales bacterium]|nr:hypothetical protein [Candidatus Obscuribacterales bacterium]